MAYPGLAERVGDIRARMQERQQLRGWTHPVTIVAVTKTHGPDAVQAAWAAGLRVVGENRVQEALEKQAACLDWAVEWHLIGRLQRNKARQAAGRFALIHSVDRAELAEELDRRTVAGTRQPILVQVNCSGEPQKGGVEPEELPALLDRIAPLVRLELRGLMTMAELTPDEALQRRAFRRLRELKDEAVARGHHLRELSMGMSSDYLVAVEEGATLVRLGTLLFGERLG
jgi:PLP dependent protein